MDKAADGLFGLTLAQFVLAARAGVRDAVCAAVTSGRPVTGVVDGRIETLEADDPRLATLSCEAHRSLGLPRPGDR